MTSTLTYTNSISEMSSTTVSPAITIITTDTTSTTTTTTLDDIESLSPFNTLTTQSSVDRLAILNEIGLSDRTFETRPGSCLDTTPRRPRTISRLARSISVRVQSTQSTHHHEITRRFSDPSVDRLTSRSLEAQDVLQDLPSINTVPKVPTTKKLERWNSQKGKKWENINARKREEEFRRRLEDHKWNQRIKLMKGLLGRFICRGEANDRLGDLKGKGRRPMRF